MKSRMADAILDASAALAVLQDERGADVVRDWHERALLTSVNASEVVVKLIRYGAAPEAAQTLVRMLGSEIVDVDANLGLQAGALYARTSHAGLSLGDRICLALALREGLPVLTADRAWASLDIGVEIRLIR